MSLIIDINPVPWKILDLVRARILKNRAKKAKKATDWSKETLKREMSLQPGPLSRRKRDEPSFLTAGAVDVGIGWFHIGRNYNVTDTFEVSNSGWSNGNPYLYFYEAQFLFFQPNNSFSPEAWVPESGPTSRTITTTQTSSATLEFIITVGSRSGEAWKQATYKLNFSGTGSKSESETHLYDDNTLFGPYYKRYQTIYSGSHNFLARIQYGLFPAGQSSILLVISIAQYKRNNWFYDGGIAKAFDDPIPFGGGQSRGTLVLENTKQISFLITASEVTELTHSLPAFMQKDINSVLLADSTANPNEAQSVFFQAVSMNTANPATVKPSFSQAPIGVYQGNAPWSVPSERVSSVIFESIGSDGTLNTVSSQQAKSSYGEFSGNAEIPVLGYKRDEPSAPSTPRTESGLFGIITGASVTSPVTTEMLDAGLDDELELSPGPNAEDRPEPVKLIIAYDYHGGNYCVDQLRLLGINL